MDTEVLGLIEVRVDDPLITDREIVEQDVPLLVKEVKAQQDRIALLEQVLYDIDRECAFPHVGIFDLSATPRVETRKITSLIANARVRRFERLGILW